ncbi:hypothetical protein SLS60_000615 [Paraconiothyrium brasiliense]|uniref:Uncharacterized protein n=1 Tax=Paraconiothyrium brasiliense TaxID=300254 RepID=A0ABR3S7V8_9PLEO
MNLWRDALGGTSGPNTGFHLYFSPTFVNLQKQFCYAEGSYNPKTAQGSWNAQLYHKQDALVVSYRPVDENGNKPATSATLGYTPDDALLFWQPRQARHYMQIADKDDVARIAHELGHGEQYSMSEISLGFYMSTNALIVRYFTFTTSSLCQQESLANLTMYRAGDTVIEYRPENVAGYAEALAAAISDGVPEDEARNKLRDDVWFCQKYNFRGSAYVKGSDQPGIIQGDPDKGPLDFDFDSIMIYPSDAQTDTTACRNDIAHCPIVRRAGQDQNGNAKFEYMPAKYKPSVEDAKFIRKHYPWVET